MKDFFDDLGKRLGETAETVTNRAGEVIEIQRLKSQVRGLARENAVDLMELGRAIYEKYKAGEEVEETAKALCDAISSRETTMNEYEKKISYIKGAAECPNCGKMITKGMVYCPYCGEKAPVVEEPEEAKEKVVEEPEETSAETPSEETAEAQAEETAEKTTEETTDAE